MTISFYCVKHPLAKKLLLVSLLNREILLEMRDSFRMAVIIVHAAIYNLWDFDAS